MLNVQEEEKPVLTTFSYFCKIWIEPTIFPHKCQPMENMTECGFVYLFRDHTRYEIMSNFDVKHSQVVSLFFYLLLCMENVTGCGVAGPEERAQPLPVFSKVQTRCHIHSSTGRCRPYVTVETSPHTCIHLGKPQETIYAYFLIVVF